MVYVEILAGGVGNRFNNKQIPKQFNKIYNKPIIIYTIEKFIDVKEVDKIIICCLKEWKSQLKKFINKYISTEKEIIIVDAGVDRNDSIMCGCLYIKENFGINEDDIILTIDAVRMLVNKRIILENIKYAKIYDAVGTYFPVTDTVVEIKDDLINKMPNRENMYFAQAPQTFNLKKLINYYQKTSLEDRSRMTDAGKIFFLNNENIYIVKGDIKNIKITYKGDIAVAKKFLSLEEQEFATENTKKSMNK